MRLRDIAATIDKWAPSVTFDRPPRQKNAPSVEMKGFTEVLEAVKNLQKTGAFDSEIEAILMNEELASGTDPIFVNSQTADSFCVAVANLRNTAESVRYAISLVISDSDETTIGMKLPPELDLQGLSDVTQKIDRFLNLAVVNEVIQGKVQLKGFDSGSEWFVLSVGTIKAVTSIGGLLMFILNVTEKKLEIEKKKLEMEILNLDKETHERVHACSEKTIQKFCKSEFDSLLKKLGIKKSDGEIVRRLEEAKSVLEELLAEGMEIQPSLDAPDDVKTLFPGYKALAGEPPQLEAGNDDIEDET